MRNISNISQFPLKAIFAVHFLLVVWSLEGWSCLSIAFYNTLFFLCIFWAIHNVESDEPIQFALFISLASEFFDFINLSVNSPFNSIISSSFGKFSASMVIINMIVRVLTMMYLLRIGQSRGGSLSTLFASPTMGLGRQDYEDISHPVPQNSDFASI